MKNKIQVVPLIKAWPKKNEACKKILKVKI